MLGPLVPVGKTYTCRQIREFDQVSAIQLSMSLALFVLPVISAGTELACDPSTRLYLGGG